ncbi:hypothetical protein BCR22_01565 [Enterococcus plantarum]|uniref:Uncharacterized protein n=1 Tax=Enterococcus plantarum TaxID=1077675 RepID=A0A2W3YTT5_9ENTE|nr:hypothetical protein [Enterococcus plantarum]MBO0421913.1 hypothetical protein [Enterococcus plantarum]MBO0466423.1 hypothetical protein [Enterococcus plantarum]OEG17371.1 hypothetical protein BCR22_01565 [Enterococcus plantarum]PZL71328.1 hypothetical protein CI088_12765 [Enterococcus plantarum]
MFSGEIVERLPELVSHCPTEVDQFVWFSGGILFWMIHWRSQRKMYEKIGISKLEQKIIRILGDYEVLFKNGYCVLVRKADC